MKRFFGAASCGTSPHGRRRSTQPPGRRSAVVAVKEAICEVRNRQLHAQASLARVPVARYPAMMNEMELFPAEGTRNATGLVPIALTTIVLTATDAAAVGQWLRGLYRQDGRQRIDPRRPAQKRTGA